MPLPAALRRPAASPPPPLALLLRVLVVFLTPFASAAQARFDALSDGEWEQLFDDRAAVRSDVLPELWVEHARSYWTDEFLADENGQAYNFVRRSEKQSDEMRDPLDRKSPERYRIFWACDSPRQAQGKHRSLCTDEPTPGQPRPPRHGGSHTTPSHVLHIFH